MTTSSNPKVEADLIRATERERIRALVEANMEVARQLHADDFQLINPRGQSLSKEQYLGGIASGDLDYLVWEPESIEVRLYDQAAAIRYQSQLEIVVQGQKVPRQRYWHTDSYEKRNGRWQVVWSQATGIM
ncbi:MAG TPA: nuclear transport factor 2 family protein [Pyrinomonadaceae bacterium]|nr:nuclear transport factor 2 family protein [Pyrinomonadaceae bacterium]